jgi:hypothetical protein
LEYTRQLRNKQDNRIKINPYKPAVSEAHPAIEMLHALSCLSGSGETTSHVSTAGCASLTCGYENPAFQAGNSHGESRFYDYRIISNFINHYIIILNTSHIHGFSGSGKNQLFISDDNRLYILS